MAVSGAPREMASLLAAASERFNATRHSAADETAALAQLIAPLSLREFFETYWGRRPYAAVEEPAARFAQLFSVRAVDAILVHGGMGEADAFRIVRSEDGTARTLPGSERGPLPMATYYQAYDEGYTIVLNALHRRWRSIASLAAQLERALLHPIGVNAYFTPPRAQGFAAHADDHDVLILQIDGAKDWKLREQTQTDATPTSTTAKLRAGNLLYIPRGVVHEAKTSHERSLHLTVSINVTSWLDLLVDALRTSAAQLPELAAPLGPRFLAASPGRHANALRGLLERIDLTPGVEAVFARMESTLVRNTDPLPDGHFEAIEAARSLTLDTNLRRRQLAFTRVARTGTTASVSFDGNHVDGPAFLEPALKFIATAALFRPRDLPGRLTDAAKLVLCTRMVREGLLTIGGVE